MENAIQVILLSFVTAFTLTYFAIPSIIHLARAKNLMDEPGERRSHTVSTPSLGGIGIFAGSIFSIVLWTPFQDFGDLQYILCSFIIIFLIGAKDDISPMAANKKLIAQIIAASILVLKSNIMLSGLYGLFGVDQDLPYWIMVLVSIFTILVIMNAFNLIDGINGLAGSVGVLIIGTLGCWFFLVDKLEFATLSFATTGAVMAFLRYNFSPARIFMGDTGSLLIGLISAILVIEFIDLNYSMDPQHPYRFDAIPAVAIGIMIIPLFDTLRVFVTRMIRGRSPFSPDRSHIHHLLIDFGYSHMKATSILVFVNVSFIVLVLSLHDQVDVHILLGGTVLVAGGMTYFLFRKVQERKGLARNQ